MNKSATHDCGKPRGPIWKVSWAGVKDKWPSAYEAIKKFNISNEEMDALITKVDLEGKSVDEVVAEWMKANEPKWKGWIGR
jgi:glycine betaine/proline transport system substrate-binding protein